MINWDDILCRILTSLLIAVFVSLIVVDVYEIVSALIDPGAYHFGNEMFWWDRTQTTYVVFCAVHVLYLLTALGCSMFIKCWKRVILLFALLLLYLTVDISVVYIFQ